MVVVVLKGKEIHEFTFRASLLNLKNLHTSPPRSWLPDLSKKIAWLKSGLENSNTKGNAVSSSVVMPQGACLEMGNPKESRMNELMPFEERRDRGNGFDAGCDVDPNV
ncbi:hypothetical protein IFM89_018823 [Coptis chinensis]|uniref:Uncharacterized protein n=1 Tax=Coptis chinensis TaxID=261450 RepID=A0A835H030_9MAGN|nr:hypothetical protein IFM89_018823 [Coptis chinensis]